MLASDLQKKDIINLKTGTKIGKIIDIDISESGTITNFIIGNIHYLKRFNQTETKISYQDIKTIGSDVILIDSNSI